jgi:hypothetical protein
VRARRRCRACARMAFGHPRVPAGHAALMLPCNIILAAMR